MNIIIAGYKLTEVLYDGTTTLVYRGVKDSETTSAIVKTLKAEYPTIEQLARLKHEYKILQSLDIEGIAKPLALNSHRNGLALILSDFGGEPLTKIINAANFKLESFLQVGIQLASTIARLHQNNIIHKDIKPQNILIDPTTGRVRIIDFSISSQLSREDRATQQPREVDANPNSFEGTLAYISPEQTGRKLLF